MSPLSPAVLLIVFNRPDTTRVVFEAIRKVQPFRFYVVADGPRDYVDGEADLCKEVRDIFMEIDWICEFKSLFREKNLGCGRSVKEAIDWFFTHENMGIILEDDTLPSNTFFEYCNYLLTKYENDNRIGMIAGTNHINYCTKNLSYCFSINKACWGWATWKRAWINMDFDMEWINSSQKTDVLQNMGRTKISYLFWENAIISIQNKLVSAWDWQWYFSLSMSNQLCIFPCKNLIANIGFGEKATHTKGLPKKEYVDIYDLDFPLKCPKYVVPDYVFDIKFEKSKLNINSILDRAVKFLKKALRQ